MRPRHAARPPTTALLRRLLLLVCACVLLPWSVPLAAQEAIEQGGRFEIRSAFLEPVDGVYHLYATLDLSLSRSALDAVREGVPLLFELNISLDRRRAFLPDEQVAFLLQRWQLQYHALSQRYLVSNLNSGQQTSYSSLGAALAALSEVRGLPVIDEPLVSEGGRYEVSARMVVTIEGGLPNAVRTIMFWIDWRRATDWYTWTLTP